MTTRPNVTAITRRRALHALAAGASTLALAACTSGTSQDDGTDTAGTAGSLDDTAGGGADTAVEGSDDASDETAGNGDPVWAQVPTIAFIVGVASSVSIAGFVTDPDGDPLQILKNEVALPEGVTYDAANQRFVYDGLGPAGSTDGHVLTADDGAA